MKSNFGRLANTLNSLGGSTLLPPTFPTRYRVRQRVVSLSGLTRDTIPPVCFAGWDIGVHSLPSIPAQGVSRATQWLSRMSDLAEARLDVRLGAIGMSGHLRIVRYVVIHQVGCHVVLAPCSSVPISPCHSLCEGLAWLVGAARADGGYRWVCMCCG
jgi:hypothetical protein